MVRSVLLADSTAFGWLPANTTLASMGGGTVARSPELVASISCAGSLLKRGQCGQSILGLVRDAVLQPGGLLAGIAGDRPVCVRAVPARDSVPERSYEGLEQARKHWQILEVGPTILESCRDKYKGRSLHFNSAEAGEAMETVWRAAVSAMPLRGSETLDVVLCCGWNCSGATLPAECFAARQLCRAQTWSDFVRQALTQAGRRKSQNCHRVSCRNRWS